MGHFDIAEIRKLGQAEAIIWDGGPHGKADL